MIKIKEDLKDCDEVTAGQILDENPEDAYWFLQKNDDVYNDFCCKNETEDLSIAEYIYKYKWTSFIDFLLLEY